MQQSNPQYYGDCPACQAAYFAAQAAMRNSGRIYQQEQHSLKNNVVDDIECHEDLIQPLATQVDQPHLIEDLMMQDGGMMMGENDQMNYEEEEEECDDEDCEYCRMYYLQLQQQQQQQQS